MRGHESQCTLKHGDYNNHSPIVQSSPNGVHVLLLSHVSSASFYYLFQKSLTVNARPIQRAHECITIGLHKTKSTKYV